MNRNIPAVHTKHFICRFGFILLLFGLLSRANLAIADDQGTKPADKPAATQPAGNDAGKKDAIAEAAHKIDLSRPASTVKFYGDMGVGCVAVIGHSRCAGYSSGMYSQFHLGTDVKLNDSASLSIQVQTLQFDRFH